eukprot:5864970-Prymnesium_polylepis.1
MRPEVRFAPGLLKLTRLRPPGRVGILEEQPRARVVRSRAKIDQACHWVLIWHPGLSYYARRVVRVAALLAAVHDGDRATVLLAAVPLGAASVETRTSLHTRCAGSWAADDLRLRVTKDALGADAIQSTPLGERLYHWRRY